MKSLTLLLISLLFISCSNMTIGFEEDSPFYNGPVVDTREDVSSEEKAQVKEDTEEEPKVQKEVLQQVQTPVETTPKENETTFSYERDDD